MSHEDLSDISSELEAQINNDIAQEILATQKNNPSPSPIPNDRADDTATSAVPQSEQHIAYSHLIQHMFEMDQKLDALITAHKHLLKTTETITLRINDLDSQLKTNTVKTVCTYEYAKNSPQYHQHFNKIVDLFGHTLTEIETLTSKVDSLSAAKTLQNLPSSGISFASSSTTHDAANDITANMATIAVPKKPHIPPVSAPNSVPNLPAPSHTPSQNQEVTDPMNQIIINILDKLVESKSSKAPTNQNFPTFSGTKDSMSFHRWSTIVSGILSTSEWRKLYDKDKHTFVEDGNVAPTLNNHLYSAILVKLRSPASDYASARRDLHGNGIGLLRALRMSYRTILTPGELVAVVDKFNNHSRGKEQAIESFVTDLESMYHDIVDNGGSCTPTQLKQNFLFNVGPEFSEIANQFNIGTLPPEWQTEDLHSLIPVTKKYLQSILSTRLRNRKYKEAHKQPPKFKPVAPARKPSPTEIDEKRMKRIYTAIYYQRFRIEDYKNEVGPGCCVFHGTADHKSEDCQAIKKAVAKSRANPPPASVPDSKAAPPSQPMANAVSVQQTDVPQSVMSQIDAVD